MFNFGGQYGTRTLQIKNRPRKYEKSNVVRPYWTKPPTHTHTHTPAVVEKLKIIVDRPLCTALTSKSTSQPRNANVEKRTTGGVLAGTHATSSNVFTFHTNTISLSHATAISAESPENEQDLAPP